MSRQNAPLQPITTVRNRRLSLWQSAVAQHLRVEAQADDPTLKTGALSRKIRAHAMMRAANAHAVCHVNNIPLHQAGAVMHKHGTDATMVSLSQLYFEMAEAKRTGNQDLLTELEKIPTRSYSTSDLLGWAQCLGWYLVYYYDYQYKVILNPLLPLGPEHHKPMYRDWQDPKFGNRNINYSVIKYQLPAKCKIGIIGDWGTGMDDAVALFDAVVAMQPDAIIHVGDIYYSGTSIECTTNFLNVVKQVYQKRKVKIPIFTLPGNHEYYSGGGGYYQLLDQLAVVQPSPDCQQPASYFCLRTADGALQFLGMDTGYNDHDPFDGITSFSLSAPPLLPNEIAWHKDKLDHFAGNTLLLSHHQLFSAAGALNHHWWGTPYLNDSLYATFQPYFESVVGWIWGHEHNLAAYANNTFGLSMGRLVGASSYEETQAENPYAVAYPEVPYLPGGPQLHVRDSYYNHSFAMVSVTPGIMPSITYYEFPSWGSYDPPQNPQPTALFTETFAKPTAYTKESWSFQTDNGRSKNVVNLLPAFGVLYSNSVSNIANLPMLYGSNPTTGQEINSVTGWPTNFQGEARFGTFADQVLLGCNGQLRSFNQDLVANWTYAIPNSAGLVNIAADSDRIYTGSNGYVTSLDPVTGQMLHQNGLSGLGYNEVKIALLNGMLFAVTVIPSPVGGGIFVLGLNPNDLSGKWGQNLDQAWGGLDSGSLVTDGQFLYVGYRGWVYKLDPNSGSVLVNNGLSGLGYNIVRLAVWNSGLYVGTNGSVLRLNTTDLKTQWQMNLPNAGGQIVNVLAQNGQVFAGSNGLVYRMDPEKGAPFSQVLNMPGMGDGAEVRLAWADDMLFAGANSAVRGLTTR
jgi:hypothetical protein